MMHTRASHQLQTNNIPSEVKLGWSLIVVLALSQAAYSVDQK
jgi:hypothetical protein